MTPAECLSLVREIHALERLGAVIQMTEGAAPEWVYGVGAIRHRLSWCRYILGLQDRALVDTALAHLAEEIQTAPPAPSIPAPIVSATVPIGARLIH